MISSEDISKLESENNDDDDANSKHETEKPDPCCFVAVHIGAGFHSVSKTATYKQLCDRICSNVIKLLNKGCNARNGAALAVALLENSPLTNAGLGSNLTLDEKIECDASIMDSNGFGSVGAISNVKNPIMVSLSLLDAQLKGTLSMGRVVPCMLVGNGALKWARDNNITEVSEDSLKTENMIKSHQFYMKKLDSYNQNQKQQPQNDLTLNNNNNDNHEKKLDTVGAIVFDSNGNFASAVSSGGILLKHPGRVGHASMYGCGCWVQTEEEENQEKELNSLNNKEKHSVAICTTGCGEYIIKTLFARECAEHILKNKHQTEYNLTEFYKKKFFNSPMLKNYSDKLIGALICKYEESHTNKTIDLIASHSTPSMCFGYISSNMTKPVSVMSRLNDEKQKDSVCITNFHIDLSQDNNSKLKNGIKKQRLS